MVDKNFWQGKKVFLTGHSGFKGSWLSIWLNSMGSIVTGYSLPPNTSPSLFDKAGIADLIDRSIFGDIRKLDQLSKDLMDASPEIVIHMAAQALVRDSYSNPIETYETNVMGTANLLESVRSCPSVKSVLIITTDKCYENKEWVWGYRENEPLGGHDPYSSSKACAELVTSAYQKSFFPDHAYGMHGVAIASARAGNVIGGGDWSKDRLIPDAIRALEKNETLMIRNPGATRPWQHVLEPLSGYLTLSERLYTQGVEYASAWNFGPRDADVKTVREVVDLLAKKFKGQFRWEHEIAPQVHEANLLKLDCSKAQSFLNWQPRWNLDQALDAIVDWHLRSKGLPLEIQKLCMEQIQAYAESGA